jgi:hypothetical protein
LKNILGLLLLAAWLPTTAHCGLEQFGVLPSDTCCEEDKSASHRCAGGCSIVEDGAFKTECSTSLPAPPVGIAIIIDLAQVSVSASERLDVFQPPFEASCLPQFVIRTALPIRGPSVAS